MYNVEGKERGMAGGDGHDSRAILLYLVAMMFVNTAHKIALENINIELSKTQIQDFGTYYVSKCRERVDLHHYGS